MTDPWAEAIADLASWRDRGDRQAARRALGFLEPQLRARVPVEARRRLDPDVIDEGLQSFLEKMLRVDLGQKIQHPRAYLIRSFKNHFLDLEAARARLPSTPLRDVPNLRSPSPDPEAVLASARDGAALQDALAGLSITDRVALKLADAPEWLTDEELAWIAEQTGRRVERVVALVDSIQSRFDAMEVFNPVGREDLETGRRHRMERFRRRRARARAKLRAALGREAS